MSAFHLRPAELGDVRPMINMLAEAVPSCSPQTVWDIPWSWRNYRVVCDDDGTIHAVGSLQEVDGHTVELRGLTVSPRKRGHGLAALLLSHLLDRARDAGMRMVCVTKNPAFFERFGFRHTAPHWLEHDPHRRLGLGARTPSARVAMASTAHA